MPYSKKNRLNNDDLQISFIYSLEDNLLLEVTPDKFTDFPSFIAALFSLWLNHHHLNSVGFAFKELNLNQLSFYLISCWKRLSKFDREVNSIQLWFLAMFQRSVLLTKKVDHWQKILAIVGTKAKPWGA